MAKQKPRQQTEEVIGTFRFEDVDLLNTDLSKLLSCFHLSDEVKAKYVQIFIQFGDFEQNEYPTDFLQIVGFRDETEEEEKARHKEEQREYEASRRRREQTRYMDS